MAFGSYGGGDWNFQVMDGAVRMLIDKIKGESKAKISYYGMCYPMRVHPARRALAQWMINHWPELAAEGGCNPDLPPPEILTVGF